MLTAKTRFYESHVGQGARKKEVGTYEFKKVSPQQL